LILSDTPDPEHGRELILPFAVSDRASAIATVSLDDLLAALREG
jgi:hypothetical protein